MFLTVLGFASLLIFISFSWYSNTCMLSLTRCPCTKDRSKPFSLLSRILPTKKGCKQDVYQGQCLERSNWVPNVYTIPGTSNRLNSRNQSRPGIVGPVFFGPNPSIPSTFQPTGLFAYGSWRLLGQMAGPADPTEVGCTSGRAAFPSSFHMRSATSHHSGSTVSHCRVAPRR